MVKAIEQLTENYHRFSIADIIKRLPDELKIKWNDNSIRTNISSILSGLARRGYLLRVDDLKGNEKQSDVSITRQGRSFVLGFIWPVLAIVEGRSLTDEQRARIDLVKREVDNFARTSAELYYPHSDSAKKKAEKKCRAKLINLLLESDQPMTTSELEEEVGISKDTVRKYLKSPIEGSERVATNTGERPSTVRVEKRKGVNYYSIDA